MNEIWSCTLLIFLLMYMYISLYISRRYGAKIVGWPTAIKSKDYTTFFIAIPQTVLILNAVVALNSANYEYFQVLTGFIIMVTGMGFNLAVRTDLGKNWVPLFKTTEGQELVTEGIYSRIRHPFYLSVLILFLGIAIISWNLYGLLCYTLILTAIIIRIKKEEKELIIKFKEKYTQYKEKTPLLMPKLK